MFFVGILNCGVHAQDGYRIEVNIDHYEGNELYLAYYLGDKQFISDTTYRENGKFIFEGPENKPPGLYMVVLPPENAIIEIILTKDEQTFTMSTDRNNLYGALEVEGSNVLNSFIKYGRFISERSWQVRELNQNIENATGEEKERLEKRLKELSEQVMNYQDQVIEENDGNFFSALIRASKEVPYRQEAPEELTGQDRVEYLLWKYIEDYTDNIDFSSEGLLRTPVYKRKIDGYLALMVQEKDSLIKASDFLIESASDNEETFKYMLISLLNRFAGSQSETEEAVYAHLALSYYQNDPRVDWVDPEQRERILNSARKIRQSSQ